MDFDIYIPFYVLICRFEYLGGLVSLWTLEIVFGLNLLCVIMHEFSYRGTESKTKKTQIGAVISEIKL